MTRESASKKKKDLKRGGRKANKKLDHERTEGIEVPGEKKPGRMDPKKKKKMLEEMNRA